MTTPTGRRYYWSMTTPGTYTRPCRQCWQEFEQPIDPGRSREYCSNRCRQKSYRERGGRASGTHKPSPKAEQKRREEEAWAADEARKERERQRSRDRRAAAAGRAEERIVTPEWTLPRWQDTPEQAKKREICRLLFVRVAHGGTPIPEAKTCEEKAKQLRARYEL